ncbi:hypothetical protein [Williamsia sp. CHRR-6]|nr:hypothetical protein [Williamsia sp. CHRR-6]MBT0566897.1 hypothetical protein [Williamsia sp. CHRR-6]
MTDIDDRPSRTWWQAIAEAFTSPWSALAAHPEACLPASLPDVGIAAER